MAGASMKEIKLRIRSMESTRHITKAMQMVATSKLRHAEEAVRRSRPYFELVYSTMAEIAANDRDLESPYLIPRPVKKSLYVVVAGDRGLAGGYNHNVLKLAEEDMRGKNTCVVPIGKKALETLRNHGFEIFSDALPEAASVSISDSYTLSRSLCDAYLAGEVDEVFVVYTNFASMLAQTPAILRVLPLEHDPSARPSGDIPLYEPDSETVFNRIVPEYVGGILYGALRESEASEQAARRNAMDSATKNADEMIGDLSLKYNRARQGAITQEITEIVAGADA